MKFAVVMVVLATLPSGISVAEVPEGPWQLFLDDAWIESTTGCTRTLHQPTKHKANPLIRGDAPWARNPYCFGSVLYDESESIYKLWYMSYNYGLPLAERTPVLYATSADGIAWERPDLGIYEFRGTRQNNIVLSHYGHHDLYAPCVVKDELDPDAGRRYKMVWWDFPLGPQGYQDDGMCIAFSPDGIHWNKHERNPVLHAFKRERSISDVMSVFYDSRHGKFVAYTKGWADPWPAFRQVVRTESHNFIDWTEPTVVLHHAHDTRDPQSYGMFVTPYENLYIGLLPMYKNPGDETIDIQLTVSHDNRQWSRVADQQTFLPTGPPGSWDDGMISVAPLIVRGDRVLIYYGGWDGPHNTNKRSAAIGLATLRKDGFVSLDCDADGGTITTVPMRGGGGAPLHVNVSASDGIARVEVLDADGTAIPGYAAGDCEPIRGDHLSRRVTWGERDALPGGEEDVFRLRIVARSAAIFSFSAGAKLVRRDR